MLDFQQKRKVRSIMYSRITLGILAVLFLVALHSTWSVFKKKQESEVVKNISLEHVEELRNRDNDLKDQIKSLDTISGLEAEIRSRFSVAKENEAMVIVIVDEDEKTTIVVPKPSFWSRFKKLFTL